ncbi:MAG: dienelactone hydrolase family protein [Dehalococcoidales bacterium]|nr:dienelactone hydrolase family protein [Dehalococcoidales bacterium]
MNEKSKLGEGNTVQFPAGNAVLEGDLSIPEKARSIIVFAHGSGSSRFSPRNRYVARVLREKGMATFLLDLLTRKEEADDIQSGRFRFDIGLLASRLVETTDWLRQNTDTRDLNIGYFGASTGAAAALMAAAERAGEVTAIVSRGGRPDLAAAALGNVKTPTLLIVGGRDVPVIALNREALAKLRGVKELAIVPGATHLFEEPGALEEVARLAANWFLKYLDYRSA